MKVEFTINNKKVQGDVVATIGDWYKALFVISMPDNTFVKMPIELCKKIA